MAFLELRAVTAQISSNTFPTTRSSMALMSMHMSGVSQVLPALGTLANLLGIEGLIGAEVDWRHTRAPNFARRALRSFSYWSRSKMKCWCCDSGTTGPATSSSHPNSDQVTV